MVEQLAGLNWNGSTMLLAAEEIYAAPKKAATHRPPGPQPAANRP